MAEVKNIVELSISEQIDRCRDGRSQKSIVEKMNKPNAKMTDVMFSRKKKAKVLKDSFSEPELKALSKILGCKIKQNLE